MGGYMYIYSGSMIYVVRGSGKSWIGQNRDHRDHPFNGLDIPAFGVRPPPIYIVPRALPIDVHRAILLVVLLRRSSDQEF